MTDTTYDDMSLRDLLRLDPVTLDAIPEVYALYRDDDWYDDIEALDVAPDDPDAAPDDSGAGPGGEVGVVAWVFALPEGRAFVMSVGDEGRHMCSTSLERASGFWAEVFDTDLKAVRAAT